jgi:hypothetical protein
MAGQPWTEGLKMSWSGSSGAPASASGSSSYVPAPAGPAFMGAAGGGGYVAPDVLGGAMGGGEGEGPMLA